MGGAQLRDECTGVRVRALLQVCADKAQEGGPAFRPRDELVQHVRLHRDPIHVAEEALRLRHVEAKGVRVHAHDGAAGPDAG